MRHTVYLPNSLEPILGTLVALRHDEHPGSRPSASAVIADALLVYAAKVDADRIRTHGPTANDQKNARLIAEALKAQGYITAFEAPNA